MERSRPRAAAELARAESEASGRSDADSNQGPSPQAETVGMLRRRVGELDRRIAYLARMTSLIEVVEAPANPERVSFGLFIEVEEEGASREYRIVGAEESDPDRGLLSWASPFARALMGKRPGEIALVKLPRGEKRLRVLRLRAPS